MKIIKISALWCPGCIIVDKNVDKIIKEYPSIELIEYDYDFDSEEVKKYNVGNVLPVLIFINNEIEIDRIIGEKTYEQIKERIVGVI
jgi:thiol-disulfide isomerase/thioredoxin